MKFLNKIISYFPTKNKVILLIQYQMVIKIMNDYDGTQCYNTPDKLFANVLNPERKRIRVELEKLGVDEYKCEHGKTFGLNQICNCNDIKNK